MKYLNFFYFCGSFLSSWIRIRIPKTDRDPDPLTWSNPDRIRIRNSGHNYTKLTRSRLSTVVRSRDRPATFRKGFQKKRQTTSSTTGKYCDRKMSNMTGGYQIHRQIWQMDKQTDRLTSLEEHTVGPEPKRTLLVFTTVWSYLIRSNVQSTLVYYCFIWSTFV